MNERILILDFGSQYTQLIARRVREAHVYCEIHPCTVDLDFVRDFDPKGIILSGSPFSVQQEGAPMVDKALFELGDRFLPRKMALDRADQVCEGRGPGRGAAAEAERARPHPRRLAHLPPRQ